MIPSEDINALNAELNPIRRLLALVGARHIVHVSRIRVKAELVILSANVLCRAYTSRFWTSCGHQIIFLNQTLQKTVKYPSAIKSRN